jgi:hypothetical protein
VSIPYNKKCNEQIMELQREGAHQPHSVTIPWDYHPRFGWEKYAPLFPPHDFHAKASKYLLKRPVIEIP